MLKLCLAGTYPLDESRIGGGVEHAVYTLAQTLAERRDVELHVVSPAPSVSGTRVVDKGGWTVHYVGPPGPGLQPPIFRFPRAIVPVMEEIAPDIVNSHNHVTSVGSVLAGCPVVHTIHGVSFREIPYAFGRAKIADYINSLHNDKAIRMSDSFLAVSQYALDEYARLIGNKPQYLMYLPIEDVFWTVPEMESPKQLVFAGGIGMRKNLLTLVKSLPAVLARHPDAKLNVCGGISDRAYYQKVLETARQLNVKDNIEFHGIVDRHRLVELLEASVALVLPAYQETTPTVICQAMAASRVAVASAAGGIPGMIDDGVTGYLVDPNDPSSMADRLNRLLDDPDRAREIGRAARIVAERRYERHKVADAVLNVCKAEFARIAEERGRARIGRCT